MQQRGWPKAGIAAMVALACLVAGQVPSADAGNLLICQYDARGGHGYGLSEWVTFSAALDAATGNQVTVTTSQLTNLGVMFTYDAILLDLRDTTNLTTTEMNNLTAYINSGRRLLMIGENTTWSTFDNQLMALAGGTFSGSDYSGNTNAAVSNDITNGAGTVVVYAGGIATGGTALYDVNFATLWGANVLTVLDVNIFDDDHSAEQNNGQFVTNVANWLGAAEGNDGDETSPRARKLRVVANLTALLPTFDKNYDKWIPKSIACVQLSLWPGCWADDNHLTLYGQAVFAQEYEAIEDRLDKMLANPSLDAGLRAVVQAAVNDLIAADEALALTALAEAIAGAGPGKTQQKEVAEAGKDYNAGLAIAAAGGAKIRVRYAIRAFRDSWVHSQKALGRKPK